MAEGYPTINPEQGYCIHVVFDIRAGWNTDGDLILYNKLLLVLYCCRPFPFRNVNSNVAAIPVLLGKSVLFGDNGHYSVFATEVISPYAGRVYYFIAFLVNLWKFARNMGVLRCAG